MRPFVMSDTNNPKQPKMTMKPSMTSNTFHHTVQHVDGTTFHTHVMAITLKTDKKHVVAVVADIRCYIQRPHFP